jgi:Ca2+-binding EF-hand superfamily protein
MKLAMMFIILLASAFVEMSSEGRTVTKEESKDFMIGVAVIPLAFAVFCLAQVVWRNYFAKAESYIDRLLFAQRFRDVMTLACHLSNAEFTQLVTTELCDDDRDNLIQAADVLVSSVLKMQPGSSLRKRRIIAGAPYVVATNTSIDEAITKYGIEDLPAMTEWSLLRRLVEKLEGITSEQRKRLANKVNKKFQGAFEFLDTSGDGTVSREEFMSVVRKRFEVVAGPEETISDEDIGTVFDMMDLDGSGSLTISELGAVLEFAAKTFDPIKGTKRATTNAVGKAQDKREEPSRPKLNQIVPEEFSSLDEKPQLCSEGDVLV